MHHSSHSYLSQLSETSSVPVSSGRVVVAGLCVWVCAVGSSVVLSMPGAGAGDARDEIVAGTPGETHSPPL